MLEVTKALEEVRELYTRVLGTPAPEIQPAEFVPFPPGVDPVEHALRETDELKKLSELLAARPVVHWVPRADMWAGKEELLFRVEVPGLKREELKVFVAGPELVVRGRAATVDVKGLQPLALERPLGTFERRFALPVGAQADTVDANYADGVLDVRIQVQSESKLEEQAVEVH